MFLRKLTVLFVPLLLLAAVCIADPLIGRMELVFLGPVLKGFLAGILLALVLPLSGATRSREPFAGLLWIPALLILLTIVWQYIASTGVSVPVLNILSTQDSELLAIESLFCGFLFTQCFRTLR